MCSPRLRKGNRRSLAGHGWRELSASWPNEGHAAEGGGRGVGLAAPVSLRAIIERCLGCSASCGGGASR